MHHKSGKDNTSWKWFEDSDKDPGIYPALIIKGIPMEKKIRAHTHPAATLIEILQQIILSLSISHVYTQTVTLTVSGFVVIQALLFILGVNILSLGDPV